MIVQAGTRWFRDPPCSQEDAVTDESVASPDHEDALADKGLSPDLSEEELGHFLSHLGRVGWFIEELQLLHDVHLDIHHDGRVLGGEARGIRVSIV